MTHMPRVERPRSSSTRSRLSPAALFVNVIARISCTRARPVWTRYASRCVRTRVLPDPAPARIRSGPSPCVTAAFCGGVRPSRSAAIRSSAGAVAIAAEDRRGSGGPGPAARRSTACRTVPIRRWRTPVRRSVEAARRLGRERYKDPVLQRRWGGNAAARSPPTAPGGGRHPPSSGDRRARHPHRLVRRVTPCAATTVAARPAPAATVESAVRCLVNAERAAHALRALRPSRQLRVAAEAHGADMVAHRFFAHVSPFSGAVTDRARRAGYLAHTRDWALGEDIAWGEGTLSTPQSILTAWMNSPGHRAVILDRDFRDAGIGVTLGVPVDDGSMPGATFVLDAGAR